MNTERFKTIATAIGFEQTEDEETVFQRDGLPVGQFLALIDKIKQHGFNVAEIEISFAAADSDEVIVLAHDPDDDTAFIELISGEELTEN